MCSTVLNIYWGFCPQWATHCLALSGATQDLHQSKPFHLALEKYQICDKKTSGDLSFLLNIIDYYLAKFNTAMHTWSPIGYLVKYDIHSKPKWIV